jgi:hypothetical protein
MTTVCRKPCRAKIEVSFPRKPARVLANNVKQRRIFSSPPGLTRWSMPTCGLLKSTEVLIELRGSSPAMTRHVARMERSEIRDDREACTPLPDYASLHPGYEKDRRRKRNADRRSISCPHQRVRLAPRECRLAPTPRCGRARLSAFHHGSGLESIPSLGAASGHASGDVAERRSVTVPLPGAEADAVCAGVTHP